jgi:hypothetical protein
MRHITVVYELPNDFDTREITQHDRIAAISWSHAIHGRDAVMREVDRLRAEVSEVRALNDTLSNLLDSVATALKGEPKPLHRHSFHDLPDVALALRSEIETLEPVLTTARGVLRYDGVDPAAHHRYLKQLGSAIQRHLVAHDLPDEAPDPLGTAEADDLLDRLQAIQAPENDEDVLLEEVSEIKRLRAALAAEIDACGYAQAAAEIEAQQADKLKAELDALRGQEPVAWLRKYGFRFNRDIEPEDDGEVPLYAAPKPGERQ